MAFKYIILAITVTVVSSAVTPVSRNGYRTLRYDVGDPSTGDYKTRTEVRNNGDVAGQYTVLEPNGKLRIVDYTADDINGFRIKISWDPVVTLTPPVVPEQYQSRVRNINKTGDINVVDDLRQILATSTGTPANLKLAAKALASNPQKYYTSAFFDS